MRKPDKTEFPNLYAAWVEYGHGVEWDDLIDIKVTFNGHTYAALAWSSGDGHVEYADLASGDGGSTWEMQNDGGEEISVAVWKRARIKSMCDWLHDPTTGEMV